jgi:PAS domain S-box-containing protein
MRKTRSSRLSRAAVKPKAGAARPKQEEGDMRRSETHLAAAQRIAHVGSWEADLRSLEDFSLNPLWWSDETFRIFGYEPGSIRVTHQVFENAIASEDRNRVWAEIQAALRERKQYAVEHRIIRPDGSTRVVVEHAEVFYDRLEKRPIRFIGTVQDITERKRAEELLKHSAGVIQDLYDNAPCGYHSLDMSGVIIRINDTELKWLGYNREEIVGKIKFSDLVTPSGLQVYHRTFPLLKERGWIHDVETEMVRKNGTILPVLLSATAIRDDKGNFVASRSTVFDIAERKRMEDALRTSEARFRQIAANIEDAIYSVDARTREFCYLSPAFEKMLGYTLNDIHAMGGRSAFLARVIYKGKFDEQKGRFERWQTPPSEFGAICDEEWWRCKDGTLKCIEDRWMPVYEAGRLVTTDGVLCDVTERKRAEQAIRASLEEKTVLLKEVHHRVKNNLQIVVSLLNLQAVRIKNPVALDTLQETGNRVRSMALLHETLYLSGGLAQVNFASYIESICSHLLRSYGPKTARVKLERRMEEVSIDLDQAVACGLIINELVSNALKHAFPEGRTGRIAVELQTAEQDRVILRVADDGVGLPAQLDLRQTETLGHQLVFMLAEKLRGAVEVTRDGGTAFCITFQTKHGEERL